MAFSLHNWKTDWKKCCLCQEDKKNENLKSPPTRYHTDQDGYLMIARNIPLFHSINEMPIRLDPTRLDEGHGIEDTLRKNNAKYHQSCRALFSNTKLARAQKRIATSNICSEESSTKMRRTSLDSKCFVCFLCEKESMPPDRQAMTLKLNKRLKECAKNLSDGRLLAILSAGDVVALELKYHASCLVALYNKEKAHLTQTVNNKNLRSTPDVHPLVFSELITYMTEARISSEGPKVFRLAEMVCLYKQRLQQLGVQSPEVNSTRLKEKLLEELPELEAHKKGRDILLAFQDDVGFALADTCDFSEAIVLAKAAKILRKHMLDHKSTFDGAFCMESLEDTVPSSLLQFVGMVEHGADIKSQIRFGVSKTDTAIAQLLQYNCYARFKEGAVTHRHSKDRETPFPIYIGLSVFSRTRKRKLVQMLHENGISVSYDRVLEISAELGDAALAKYSEEGVVCPSDLQRGLFTMAAMDNIDHNPTSTTSTTSFHGTSISLFQHPNSESKGEKRDTLQLTGNKVKKVSELPDSYTNILPAHFKDKSPSPPQVTGLSLPTTNMLRPQLDLEYEWLEKVCTTEGIHGPVNLTWAAHHADKNRNPVFEVSVSSLMPLLRDQAHSVATVKHVMDKVREAVKLLNPGQVPVITADQPIYAVAKQIQWQWPECYGEEHFLIMMGGLHIEMTALRSIGSILQDSGWTGALAEAGVASSGTADSFLSAASVTKTRQAHQVTACVLYKLMKLAYAEYCTDDQLSGDSTESMNFQDWCERRKQESPQFNYWYLILSMELVILIFIRSLREANFSLYCQALCQLIPYMFANNNVNYARWLPIHLRDMMGLEKAHPQLAAIFKAGGFVIHKTTRNFSAMAVDQAHEQANAVIKGDGGAIGITEDQSALRRWMVAGPAVSQLVAQYEAASALKDVTNQTYHHEQTQKTQTSFLKKVQMLSSVMQEMGNPFQEETSDLLSLDTKIIAHPCAAERVGIHLSSGLARFDAFMEVLKREDTSLFYAPIKKTKMGFFQQEQILTNAKEKVLKKDCQLFSKLFISCQSRECDLHDFFRHENQQFPAALSDDGRLHMCQKSQLASIFETKIKVPDKEPVADAIIFDGSALVNSLPPRLSKTFAEYATLEFIPKVKPYNVKYVRMDIVFDVYLPSSLKSEARSKRGQGARRRVTEHGILPRNWHSFLRNNTNKTELFEYLAEKIIDNCKKNTIIVSKGTNAISNHQQMNICDISPCSHEEADTRIFLHVGHAVKMGVKAVIVNANDTDVLVIAVNTFPHLQELGLQKMWIGFGQGCHLKYIPIHELFLILSPEKASGILFFHAFTGCDIVSAFRGKGKKSAWQTWDICTEASKIFTKLSCFPPKIEDSDMKMLEKFVIMMYDRSSTVETVDEARFNLFARKQRSFESIPPTKAALAQHVKRAAYQAGCIWSQVLECQPVAVSPAEWGWRKEGESWSIVWTTLPSVAQSCQQLTRCQCKTLCRGRCKCYKFGLNCTAMCSCSCLD